MLQHDSARFLASDDDDALPATPALEALASTTAFMRRHGGIILLCLLLMISAAIAYMLMATPRFTAEATLYIERQKLRVLQPEQVPGDAPVDSMAVESQVEILKSDAIASAVVARLHLADDRDFLEQHTSALSQGLNLLMQALNYLSRSTAAGEAHVGPAQQAIAVVHRDLAIARSGLSAVVKVNFVDTDPRRAARIANAVAEVYVQSQVDASRHAAQSAGAWLQGELKELQHKAATAEKEVQEFRARNDIDAQSKLNELQANADTYRRLYDSSLQRYAVTVQQQSFQLAEAHIVSPAEPPPFKSNPKPLLVLAIGAFGGLCMGLGFAMWSEQSDRTFRTPEQVGECLKTHCPAVLESVRPRSRRHLSAVRSQPWSANVKGIDAGLFSYVMAHPASQYAESLRAMKVSCDLNMAPGSKIIGFTSSLEKEGKSTAAANFARLVSRGGRLTMLVDADFHTVALSRALVSSASLAWPDVMLGRADLDDVRFDLGSNMHFLPLIGQAEPFEPSEFLGSAATREFFARLRSRYDYVVVDLPPLAPVVDVRATTASIDAYFFVVEWGRTSIATAQRALGSAESVHEKVLGVVLNKVDLAAMRRYGLGCHDRSEYYGSRASVA
jgi:polysaccharide biosynthesis transport protein